MENLLVENEIFCDLDSIKLDLDSDLFDLSPFEFERVAATTAGPETAGGTSAVVEDAFGGSAQGKPKIETDDSNTTSNNNSGADDAKEALASLSSLLSPPSTPVITSNNLQQPSWNMDSLLKSRQRELQSQPQSSQPPVDGIFSSFDAQPPPPNKNIINHQDKNVIQKILDGLQQQPQPSSTSPGSSTATPAVQRRPTIVVSAIRDETLKNSLPKFKLEMIKEATTSFMTSANSTTQQQSQPTASRTLVPETNHPIMLHKPLIAKDQKSGSLQLLPESLVNMDGRILNLGDLLSASGLHKNLICNLDIKPFFNNPTTTPSGSLTPPINSASSVNFGQYSQQQQQQQQLQEQPQPHLKGPVSAPASKMAVGASSNNDHSSHGLVHKLLASPINQLVQPWQIQQQQLQQQAGASSLGSASTVNTPKMATTADVDANTLFPTNHSALAQKKLDIKPKILAEATSLENVFPDSFSNKISSTLVSNTKNGTAAAINWGGGGGGGGTGGGGGGGLGESISSGKSSPENPLRSVIEGRINQAKQQAALKAASPAVSVKREVEGFVDDGSAQSDEKSRAASVGVFMEADRHHHQSTAASNAATQQRGAISMPSSPISCGDRESFFDAFVKTDLDEIIPEPLDNDCIICGLAFPNQAALRDHIEEHRDHVSMIQSGVGQSASLIDSPPYSSNSSVVGSEETNNGTSSGCPSMADAAEFYVNTSMPASPASSTSSLDQLLATTASPVRGGSCSSSGNNALKNANLNGTSRRIDTGSTLASLLVSNISPLLSSMDAATQQLKCGAPGNNRPTPILPIQRVNQGFGQNLLASTLGGNNSNGTAVASNVALQRTGFVANLFQQQQNAGMAKWKKTGVANGIGVSTLLGGVGVGTGTSSSSITDQPQFFGKVMSTDQKKMLVKAVDGAAIVAAAAKAGQKRKLPAMTGMGMGISKSCPVSPAMKDMMMGTIGGLEGHVAVGASVGGAVGGMTSGSDMMAGHQGPKTKKCRRVYGLNQKNLWCTQCQWKKACARFKPPKQ